jgi:hypothetical protein
MRKKPMGLTWHLILGKPTFKNFTEGFYEFYYYFLAWKKCLFNEGYDNDFFFYFLMDNLF